MRDFRQNIEKSYNKFLYSLYIARAPFQVEKGGKGLFTSIGLNKSLLPLGLFIHQSKFHYNLRLSFLNLVHVLNGRCLYIPGQRCLSYDINRNELARAFNLLLAI
jgi:hypothetical protein